MSTSGDRPFDEHTTPEALRALLDRHVNQQLLTAKLSRLALRARYADVLREAVEGLREGVDADNAEVLELVPSETSFHLRYAVGLDDATQFDEIEPAGSQTARGHALRHNQVVIVDDFDAQTRFERASRLTQRGIKASITVRIPGLKRPIGVLSAHSRHPGHFSNDDVEFIRTVANIIGECAESERSEEQRKRMYEELHRAMDVREEMLSVISHDLRSPASAIKLSLEVVRRAVKDPGGPITPEQVERAILKANSNLDRMMSMMDDLLTMSRAETDAFDINWEEVDLREVVEEAIADHERAIEASGSQISIEGPDVLVGQWDWVRVEQLVANLLSNAIKYGQGSPITITLEADEQTATLRIHDRGRGIPKGERKRIFERYVRVGPKKEGKGNNSYGLGLWIVKRVVDSLHGTIRVDSTPGEGTTFEVKLPRNVEAETR
ncbi:GAF domain-containing sensor histidine kinase [Persicimonas caeni]|nr:GAF domain-containing sensor histidine kinase [Persicimonas caeni]